MARQGALGVEELIRKKVANIRHWKMTKLGKRSRKLGFEFTVMTYNILSQTAVENHRYLYKNCSPRFLEEDYRISKLMPEILRTKSDVICLQEVEQQLFDDTIKNVFHSNGFESIFKRRTGSKSDGCAILWRKAKFNLLRHKGIDFSTRDCEILDRDNVGLIVVLKPRYPGCGRAQLHVATTHLLYNPRRGDIKFCQLRLLLAELENMALRNVTESGRLYHPVILCGDFNFEPHSSLYEFIETGRLDVWNMKSGNMSGQVEGRNKGRRVNGGLLSLHELGISETGRFENPSAGPSSDVSGSPSKTGVPNTAEKSAGATESANIKSTDARTDSKYQAPPTASNASVSKSCLAVNGRPVSSKWLEEIESSNNPEWLAALRALQNMSGIPTSSQNVSVTSTGFNQSGNPGANLGKSEAAAEAGSSSVSDDAGQCFFHDFNFVPTYKYFQQDKKNFPVTSMTGDDFGTVDHIFYNVKVKHSVHSYVEDKLKLLGSYSLMHAEDLVDIGGLPNAYLGSDHICLMSKFLLGYK